MLYDDKDDELKTENDVPNETDGAEDPNGKDELPADETDGGNTERDVQTPAEEEKRQYDFENNEKSTYSDDRCYGTDGKKPKKPSGDSYMSKKTVGWIVAMCLVLSIICGVCASAVTQAFRKGNAEAQTTTQSTQSNEQTASETLNAETTEVVVPLQPSDTTGAISIPMITAATDGVSYESYADVVEKCINAVVQIESTEETSSIFGNYETRIAGAGVIYTSDGYIITNYHIAGATTKSITVILYDGTKYEGQFICGDESMDLAVVKISKNDCVYAKVSDSSTIRLGEDVVAIGNPLGYGITVTPGIVSALSRTVTIENTTMTLMQTSAAINSGSSGGGLFNMKGELVGITNAKVGGTSVEAMGYAIPSEKVIKCVNDFATYGYVTGLARLGVNIRNYIQIGRTAYSGLISVSSVVKGGTAEMFGIQENDIIYSIGGTECTSFANLNKILTKYKVGDTVTVTVLRPTIDASSATSYNAYLKSCEEIKLEVTFVEFNPGD